MLVSKGHFRSGMFANLIMKLCAIITAVLHYWFLHRQFQESRFASDTKRIRPLNDLWLVLLVFERYIPGPFEVVWFFRKYFCMHYCFLLRHQNCLATSDHAALDFCFPMAALGSIGDRLGLKTLRSYWSKSEFYDVFKQDKCPNLDFKRMFIC